MAINLLCICLLITVEPGGALMLSTMTEVLLAWLLFAPIAAMLLGAFIHAGSEAEQLADSVESSELVGQRP